MPPIADTQTGAVARIACRGTEGSLAGFPPLHRAARSIGTGFRSHAITAASSQVVQCISTSDASLLLGNGSLSLLLRCLAPPRPFKGGGVGVTLLLHQLSDLAQLGVHLLLLAVGLLGFLPLRTCATRQGLRCCGGGAPLPGCKAGPGQLSLPLAAVALGRPALGRHLAPASFAGPRTFARPNTCRTLPGSQNPPGS